MKDRFEIEWNSIEKTMYGDFIRLASYYIKWIMNEDIVVWGNIKTKYYLTSKSVLTNLIIFLIYRLIKIE